MRQIEGGDAEGPEAAQHGEDAQAQVVSRRHHEKVVLTFRVTGILTLQNEHTGRECSDNQTKHQEPALSVFSLLSSSRKRQVASKTDYLQYLSE